MSEPEITIPGYQIENLVGQGGFAQVFLAVQESLQRTVALKVMMPEMAADAQFCERFLREGRIVAQLSAHPHIVTIFDIGKQGAVYYMAMEYVDGGTLSGKIKQQDDSFNVDAMIIGIADALGSAHSAGFIHRDVKPGNILFTRNNVAVLSDFGIAKTVDGTTQLTQVGCSIGTPEYMSPEQVLGKKLDGRSDLYSLGVVIYQTLTGKKLFRGEDSFSTALQHLNEPAPALPKELVRYQGLLDRLLAKKPEDRFQNADQLIRYFKGEAQVGRSPTVVIKRPRRGTASGLGDKASSKRQPIKPGLWLGAVVLSLVVGASVFLTFGGRFPSGNIEPSQGVLTPTTNPSSPVLSEVNPKTARLLEVAQLHEAMGRVTSPPGSNACDAYALVLEGEPESQIAQQAVIRLECPQSP